MASSLESNKIAAAVLTAGVIAMMSGFAAELLYSPEMLEENVYTVAVADGGDAGATEVAEAPALEPIGPLLASADVANGEKVTRACTACHSFDEGGPTKIGPNLYDIVNRSITAYEGFAFSDALLEKADQVWDYENLNGFLVRPRDWAPGTKMTYAGMRKTSDRADLIAYLRSLSGSPAPLPE
ncbi:cytochrome c family protein [Pelagibius litoralis]|uniref:Cytochrome c family protein n=1 Tax=Pelagibius litoralis TaxID=374515 RepID=A0A967F1N4_9PROT|nr:cytochrome c family protein [Pelagibius litoralis]NIA71301.1 cytochrome c family protein [Pelagibius litoralis]